MTEAAPDTIPIFPLSNVVLFPTISVPLFIFEPRYRQLVQDALEGDRRIGMVAVRPGHEDEMAGDPPVFPIGCEGSITHSERRPDGTWNLLLGATRRFRIVEEPPRPGERLYRTAVVETLDEQPGDADRMRALRCEIRDGLEDLLARVAGDDDGPPPLERLDELDDPQFVNVLAQAIDFGVLEKQQLLEAPGHLERATTMRDLIQFRLVEIGAESARGGSRLH
jgi:Lon protease-like protein